MWYDHKTNTKTAHSLVWGEKSEEKTIWTKLTPTNWNDGEMNGQLDVKKLRQRRRRQRRWEDVVAHLFSIIAFIALENSLIHISPPFIKCLFFYVVFLLLMMCKINSDFCCCWWAIRSARTRSFVRTHASQMVCWLFRIASHRLGSLCSPYCSLVRCTMNCIDTPESLVCLILDLRYCWFPFRSFFTRVAVFLLS